MSINVTKLLPSPRSIFRQMRKQYELHARKLREAEAPIQAKQQFA